MLHTVGCNSSDFCVVNFEGCAYVPKACNNLPNQIVSIVLTKSLRLQIASCY